MQFSHDIIVSRSPQSPRFRCSNHPPPAGDMRHSQTRGSSSWAKSGPRIIVWGDSRGLLPMVFLPRGGRRDAKHKSPARTHSLFLSRCPVFWLLGASSSSRRTTGRCAVGHPWWACEGRLSTDKRDSWEVQQSDVMFSTFRSF